MLRYKSTEDDDGLQKMTLGVLEDATNQNLECFLTLLGVVLFVDEAVPFQGSGEAETLLRFVDNTGRMLGMRLLVAGTDATVVNLRMIEAQQR